VYRIGANTVFHTAYGVTFNPLPFSRPLRGFYPLTIAAEYVADPYLWTTTLAQGVPDLVRPDLSSGRLTLPLSYAMRTPMTDVSRSRIHSWNVAVERRIPYDISVDVAYVGTAKNGGFADIDANASDTPGGGDESRPLTQVRGNNALWLWGPLTKSRYHSLQVAINRPFKGGLLLKGAYTLSRARNGTDDDGWDQVLFNSPSQLERNFAPAGYDRPQIFQMAVVYEVPYKANRSGNRISRVLLGDWQLNGIYSAFSGTPFWVAADDVELNMPGTPQTADLHGSYTVIGKHGDAGYFFDPAPFSQPHGAVFGNTGRNQFRGPGAWNVDLSIFRALHVGGGRTRGDFRVEIFNLTNTPQWENPDAYVNSQTFGRTYGVGSHRRDAGTGERQIRLGLRFEF